MKNVFSRSQPQEIQEKYRILPFLNIFPLDKITEKNPRNSEKTKFVFSWNVFLK
jgi:hypothetical protein